MTSERSLLFLACKTEVTSIHSKESQTDSSFKEPEIIKIETTADFNINSDSFPSNAPLCPDKWNSIYSYTTGDRVTLPSTLIIWECKEQPYGHYCAHEAYEVGLEGGVYENAWKVIGRCVNGRVVEDKDYLNGKPTATAAHSELSTTTSSFENDSNMVSDISSEKNDAKIKCNLCKPGQIGINADIPTNDGVTKCMEIYDFYLQSYLEGEKECVSAQSWLNSICCEDESDIKVDTSSTTITTSASNPPTNKPITLNPTPKPITPQPNPQPVALISNLSECYVPYDTNDAYALYHKVSHSGANYICMMSNWCSDPDYEPQVGDYWRVVWEYQGPCKDSSVADTPIVIPQRPIDPNTDTASFIEASQLAQEEELAAIEDHDEDTVKTEAFVDNSEPKCPSSWKMDYAYVGGDTVGAKGQIYTCKGFPYTGQ